MALSRDEVSDLDAEHLAVHAAFDGPVYGLPASPEDTEAWLATMDPSRLLGVLDNGRLVASGEARGWT